MRIQWRNESLTTYMNRLKADNPTKSWTEIRTMAIGTKRQRISRHDPHQSVKEMSRRVKQMAAGTLTFSKTNPLRRYVNV